jgi:hypothetical protein
MGHENFDFFTKLALKFFTDYCQERLREAFVLQSNGHSKYDKNFEISTSMNIFCSFLLQCKID